ncbi:PAAR-like domain-containing protein [Pseudomonas chlororaphis]|uniref:PAAR-like domain-containing protein n=1 Tax=Pseudomonas chlororaphis TaxID=587753 RepID=UPI002365FBB9|nr:PAAR-like domain-containing protein [Pseudomonas chlororaphis]WDH20456.1 DUF4150 domain-containing protein [Pseudomonas chlororaphis]
MANQVFANNMEVSCKAAAGKSIACFPDVCFTPPQAPPTPMGVPIPYPNTGMAKDTTKGTRTVKISRKEVMLKDKSYFKTSYGDEAGNAPKKGVITSKIKGKVYFTAWSMNVKFEGENVVRHMDMTTHNHGSTSNTGPWPYVDEALMKGISAKCHDDMEKDRNACQPPHIKPHIVKDKNGVDQQRGNDCSKECKKARSCALPKKKDDKKYCCHPLVTGDHLLEVNSFTQSGGRSGVPGASSEILDALQGKGINFIFAEPRTKPRRLSTFPDYDDEEAPTACAGPQSKNFPHMRMQKHRNMRKHQYISQRELLDTWPPGEERSYWTYDEAASVAVESHQKVFKHCDPDCIRAQLDAYHHTILPGKSRAEKNATPVRTSLRPRRRR